MPVSEAFPCLQEHADRLAVIRSCYHDAFNHSPAQYALLTGQSRVGWPSVGAWVTYGLGSEADDLPAMVVMTDPDGKVKGGTPLWGNGFLPPLYQGATLQTRGTPILYLDRPEGVTERDQRATLDFAQRLNRRHSANTPAASAELDARIAAAELAFRMQAAAPEVVDVRRETAATHRLYGLEDKVHMHDAHATILSLLGLDHRKLTYLFQGRDQRLTDVGGDNDLAARLTKG